MRKNQPHSEATREKMRRSRQRRTEREQFEREEKNSVKLRKIPRYVFPVDYVDMRD